MSASLVLDNDQQKAHLSALLTQAVERDCEGGRRYLAAQKSDPEARLPPPPILETIEKSIDIRAAAYNTVREDVERHRQSGQPLTVEGFFNLYVMALTRAMMHEEAYATIFLNQIKPGDLSDEAREQIEADIRPYTKKGEPMTLIAMPSGTPLDATELEKIRMRFITVDRIGEVCFQAFFKAATGVSEINEHDPVYREFLQQAAHHLYGDDQGRGRPAGR